MISRGRDEREGSLMGKGIISGSERKARDELIL